MKEKIAVILLDDAMNGFRDTPGELANEILSLIRTEIEKAKLTPQEIDEAYVNGKLPKRAIDIVTCRRRNIAQDQLNKILKLLED